VTSEYSRVIKALKTVGGMTVISTSHAASQRDDWTLPAVIVDLEAPIWDGVHEDGALEETGNKVSLIFHAKLDDTEPTKAMKTIETNMGKGLAAIAKEFSDKSLTVESPQFDIMPFGKTGFAPGLGFMLTIDDGE
jgi:hypothetical protein